MPGLRYVLLLALLCPALAQAQEGLSPFGRLLNSSLPESRLPGVIEFVGTRGTPADLALLLQKTVEPEGLPKSVRTAALAALEKSFEERNVKPSGDLSRIGELVTGENLEPGVRASAVRLAGAWKVEALTEPLVTLATAPETSPAMREAAIGALVEIGGDASREAIEQLAAADQPLATRYRAVAGLVSFDVEAAAETAAQVLAEGDGETDPAPLFAAFLERPGASDTLAAALGQVELPPDVAKLGLRYVYSVGRNDPLLASVLSDAAGISTQPIKLSEAELQEFVADVLSEGDPRRGEAVFRRADLSCFKCHALRGAGGKVGPELTVVGASSPVDYLTRAVLDPDKDIKEEYRSAIVVTEEGKAFHGVVADETEETLELREANGKLRAFPKETLIEREEGGSLMPKGLAGFMTRNELVDLVRFLSELGRPGEYAPRNDPTFQRWRFSKNPPASVVGDVPNDEIFSATVHEPELGWTEIYATHAGEVPLDEVRALTSGEVLLLKSEIDVTSAGAIGIRLNSAEGVNVWIDGDSYAFEGNVVTADLSEGRHAVYFRVDTAERATSTLRAELVPASDSTGRTTPPGRATVVGGT